MHSIPMLRDMHAWLRWCTGRSLDAARALSPEEFKRPFEMGLGSVHATFVHLYGAERLWLAAIIGRTDGLVFPTPAELPTVDAIAAAWPAVRADWDAYLAALTDAELERVIVRVREGRAFHQRVVDGLIQVPTHALYHNAQLSSMFRQMGHQLPDSSFILWARSRTPQPAAV